MTEEEKAHSQQKLRHSSANGGLCSLSSVNIFSSTINGWPALASSSQLYISYDAWSKIYIYKNTETCMHSENRTSNVSKTSFEGSTLPDGILLRRNDRIWDKNSWVVKEENERRNVQGKNSSVGWDIQWKWIWLL